MTVTSMVKLNSLVDYVRAAIRDNYFLGILVTSQAQGRLESQGWSFGAGKSTFALNFAKHYIFNGDFEQVKRHLISFAEELKPFLAPPRTPCVIIDDMQLDFGKHKAHDQELRELAYYLTVARPEISVLIGTCSHRGMLHKDFREELFHFEVIVPERGVVEIQRLKRWIDFYNPLEIKERYDSKDFRFAPFPPLLPEEEAWYLKWREERNRKARERLKIFNKTENQNQPTIKKPSMYEFCRYAREECRIKADEYKLRKLYDHFFNV